MASIKITAHAFVHDVGDAPLLTEDALRPSLEHEEEKILEAEGLTRADLVGRGTENK